MKQLRAGICVLLMSTLLVSSGCGSNSSEDAGADTEASKEEEGSSIAKNYLGAIDRGAVVRTQGDLEAMGRALEMYLTQEGGYPEAADYAGICAALSPSYIRIPPKSDGFGGKFVGEATASSYVIRAPGPDRVLNSEDDFVLEPGGFTNLPDLGGSKLGL
jgi:hypothetical protein